MAIGLEAEDDGSGGHEDRPQGGSCGRSGPCDLEPEAAANRVETRSLGSPPRRQPIEGRSGVPRVWKCLINRRSGPRFHPAARSRVDPGDPRRRTTGSRLDRLVEHARTERSKIDRDSDTARCRERPSIGSSLWCKRPDRRSILPIGGCRPLDRGSIRAGDGVGNQDRASIRLLANSPDPTTDTSPGSLPASTPSS